MEKIYEKYSKQKEFFCLNSLFELLRIIGGIETLGEFIDMFLWVFGKDFMEFWGFFKSFFFFKKFFEFSFLKKKFDKSS